MFGKLIKNLLGKAEEAIESVNEQTNHAPQEEHVEEKPATTQQPQASTNGVPTSDEILEYRGIIPEIDRPYNHFYSAFHEALYTNDRQAVEARATDWKNYLQDAIAQANAMQPFYGDDSLKNEGISYFENKLRIIDEYFMVYADAALNNTEDSEEKYNKAEDLKSSYFNTINEALAKFEAKFEDKQRDTEVEKMFQEQEEKSLADAKDNPLLEPIHGITLFDYVAGTVKIGSGSSENEVLKTLGFDKPQWDEAGFIWQQRMQEDANMTVMTLYSKYFGEVDQHPKLGNASAESSAQASNNPNLERIKTDEKFFYELAGERDAAVDVGKDGGQHIMDKYGINLIDFQAQAMVWMRSSNFASMTTYQYEKKEEYLKQFQQESGGTIADDINF